MMDQAKSGDRNVRGGCHNSLCVNLNDLGSATQTMPECLGTEIEGDDRQWKFWNADKTNTVFLATKYGNCLHLIDRCPGLAGADPTRPLKEYTLCKFCNKGEQRRNMSQKKGK